MTDFKVGERVTIHYPTMPHRTGKIAAVIPTSWNVTEIRALLEGLQDAGYDLGTIRPNSIRSYTSYLVDCNKRLYWPHTCWLEAV